MKTYYWKVLDTRGDVVHTSARYNYLAPGRDLRRRYPTRAGYSVRRVTVTTKPKVESAAPVQFGFWTRVRLAIGL